MKNTRKKRLGSLLLEAGVILKSQLDLALTIQESKNQKLGEILVEKGWASEREITRALEVQLGIPRVELEKYKLDAKITSIIDESLAKRHMMIPFAYKDHKLQVAMSDPLNMFAIDDLKMITKMDIRPMLAATSEISLAIDQVYGEGKTEEIARHFKVESDIKPITKAEDILNSPMVKLVDSFFERAICKNASDIHIEPFEHYIRIRLRVDGQMEELLRTDISALNPMIARIKILSSLDISERRLPQDGRFQMKRDKKEFDLRVSILPTIYGEKVVVRILYRTGKKRSIGQLGFYPQDEAKVRSLLKVPNGIILVTGPTGSGKSTTLASSLREINTDHINIITVEDPVENIIEGVNQVGVNTKTGLSFALALRSILRQDPDVIMVGEMRDLETSEIAIRSAITGHLVLSTLHTNDATSSITRLIDMGLEPYMIGASLRGIIGQRLVRCICPNCREAYRITPKEHELTKIPLNQMVFKGKGCQVCKQTGYKGRMGVHEVFVVDHKMQETIAKNHLTSEALRSLALEEGMRSLEENMRSKVMEGTSTVDEMLRIIVDN